MTSKNVVYTAKIHWVLFFWPTVFACVAIYGGITHTQFKEITFFFIIFALLWGAITWIPFYFSSLTVEKEQIIFRTGILIRQTTAIPMAKIESIDIRQSLIGSLLRYGTLKITGTGGTNHIINYVEKPLTCRRYIEQLMHGK